MASDDQLADYTRNNGGTIHSPVGACRMSADTARVVGNRLRVRGIGGFRVIDAPV